MASVAGCLVTAQPFASRPLQRLPQIPQQILDVLDADAHAHGVGGDAGLLQLRRGQLAVGGRGGACGQGLASRSVGLT
jgi:hypothetical protein